MSSAPLDAHADGHDRLAENDEHQQTVPLHEVPGADPEPALPSGEKGADDLDDEGGRPEGVLQTAVREPGAQDAGGRREVERGEPEDGRGLAAPGGREQSQMHDHDAQVRRSEDDARVAEGVRNGQGDNEEAAHGQQHQDPPASGGRVARRS